jgi:hexosaminidase
MHPLRLIPRPAQLEPLPGEAFTLGADTRMAARGNGAEAVAQWLGALLRRGTGLPLAPADGDGHRGDGAEPAVAGGDDVVALRVDPASALGAEGYRLTVSPAGVRLEAPAAAGLFRGAQTLRQLLPPAIERGGVAGPWAVPAVRIEDRPRFAWRGVMLDVARHFLGADAVRRWLDLAVLYKVNVLHLHLTDDQGWRIAIDGWPRLTEHGGSTQVGGGAGGWFTQSEYAELVRHAAERHAARGC